MTDKTSGVLDPKELFLLSKGFLNVIYGTSWSGIPDKWKEGHEEKARKERLSDAVLFAGCQNCFDYGLCTESSAVAEGKKHGMGQYHKEGWHVSVHSRYSGHVVSSDVGFASYQTTIGTNHLYEMLYLVLPAEKIRNTADMFRACKIHYTDNPDWNNGITHGKLRHHRIPDFYPVHYSDNP